jgi:hypothetical protein
VLVGWDQFQLLLVSFCTLNVRKMEEGKIATAWAQFGATERSPSMYIRMRVLPWSNTLLAWGRLGSISALLVNQPVVLLVQLNVQEYGRR